MWRSQANLRFLCSWHPVAQTLLQPSPYWSPPPHLLWQKVFSIGTKCSPQFCCQFKTFENFFTFSHICLNVVVSFIFCALCISKAKSWLGGYDTWYQKLIDWLDKISGMINPSLWNDTCFSSGKYIWLHRSNLYRVWNNHETTLVLHLAFSAERAVCQF